MTVESIDVRDAALLGALQERIEVVERPWDELAERLGWAGGGGEVLARVRRLKDERVLRQVSAIFDTRSLGYASSLVAARVDPARVDEAAAVVGGHPGVSHNYLREHEYNLWYTLAVPPTSGLGLAGTVARLHRLSGAGATRLLPTVRLFKIGVRFDMGGEGGDAPSGGGHYSEAQRGVVRALEPVEREFVRLMQRDLELVERPFAAVAAELGTDIPGLRGMHEEFLATGRMRRFAGVLHHRRAGFRANAMGVWAGPQDDDAELGRIGAIMAGFRAVSHCYQRPHYPDWPYNLFTMVHGKTRDDCEAVLAEIAEATGIRERAALYSTLEYKKVRVRYFTGEEEKWEESNPG